jgi:hypothetical protein
MEQEIGPQLIDTITNTVSPLFLCNLLTIEVFEGANSIPKVGDLWIAIATSSPFQCVRFFILGIDVLFAISDKIIRIEHLGAESKVLFWRLGRNTNGKWFWNFEHDERIQYVSHQLSAGSYVIINDDPNQELELY